MDIFINRDTRKLQKSLAITTSPTPNQLDFKRGDAVTIAVYFITGGAYSQLASGSLITFIVKEKDKYDGPALVLDNDFTLSGTGATAKYSAAPSFSTEPLDEALLKDDDDSNDLAFIDLIGEISWTDGADGPVNSTETFAVRVYNDVLRGDEETPAQLPDPTDWMTAGIALSDAPVNGVAGVKQSRTLDMTGKVISVSGDVEVQLNSDLTGSLDITVALLTTDDAAAQTAKIVTAINASAAATHITATRSAAALTVEMDVAAANDTDFDFGIYEVSASYSVSEPGGSSAGNSGVAAVAGTAADRLGQIAIVDETTAYICARVTPPKWIGPFPA